MKTKHIFTIGVCLLIITAVTSCKSEDEKDVKFSSELLKLNDTSIELSKDATTRTINIEADCDWDVTATASNWSDLVVQRESQTSISIKTEENPLRSERTAILTITTKGGLKKTINVRQAQGTAYIRTDVQMLEFRELGGTQAFHIQSNTSWIISMSGDSDWLNIPEGMMTGNGNQDITLTASPAVSINQRQAILTISSTESGVTLEPVKVEATLAGLNKVELSVEPSETIRFGCIAGEGNSQNITINTNASWNAAILSIIPSGDNSWISLNVNSGTLSQRILLTCSDNITTSERQATIAFMAGGMMDSAKYVNVIQEAGQVPEITDFTNSGSIENITGKAGFTFGYTSAFPVTEYGLCYSSEHNLPTTSDTCVPMTGTATSATQVTIETGELEPRKTIYVRAYAKNAVGVAYSTNTITVTTVGDAPIAEDNPPLFSTKR